MGKYQDGLKADFEAYCGSRIANLESPPIEIPTVERRDKEMEPDEPAYDLTDEQWALLQVQEGTPTDGDYDELDWSGLSDETNDINVITGEVEE